MLMLKLSKYLLNMVHKGKMLLYKDRKALTHLMLKLKETSYIQLACYYNFVYLYLSNSYNQIYFIYPINEHQS